LDKIFEAIEKNEAIAGPGEDPIRMAISANSPSPVIPVPPTYDGSTEQTAISPDMVEPLAPPEEVADKIMEEPEEDKPKPMSFSQMHQAMQQCRNMALQLEELYESQKKEYKIDASMINKLKVYNENHFPEGEPPEGTEWEGFEGLKNITFEEVVEVVGADSPIIDNENPESTIDAITNFFDLHLNLFSIADEYRILCEQYQYALEQAEKAQLAGMIADFDRETDPELKAKKERGIQEYYAAVRLDYLANPIGNEDIKRILKSFDDERRISYLVDRVCKRLDTLHISRNFIQEINKFESRFLDERYHKQDGALLLYILYYIGYHDVYDRKVRLRIVTTAMVLDRFIRHVLEKSEEADVMKNILIFEEQILQNMDK
jgi:hypothetical protein